MKILLVNPTPKEPFSMIWPSLGLCYLSSYLKSKGIDSIEGIDLNIEGSEAALEQTIKRNDLVGIYCSTKAASEALRIAKMAKGQGKIVVLGGPHPSVLPEEILNNENVDFIILSEGEESFYELVRSLESGTLNRSIDGFGYKENGSVFINPKREYIKNLDDIPFPDRNLFNHEYLSLSFCATRGCPYKCANCQPALSLQTCAFRMRSVENVLAEIKGLQGKYLHFVDNDLTVNRKWTKEFCERLIKEDLNIRWDCQGRVNTLNLELMKLMQKAGCQSIGIGIESGSQSLLDSFLHKQIKLERAKELFEEAKSIRMPLHCWFIIGIPTETKEDIEKTIDFALHSDVASIGFSVATPWPGTIFNKIASEKGWILAKSWDEYNEKRYSKLKTDLWDPDDILSYRNIIVSEFQKKGWIINENDFIFENPDYTVSLSSKAKRVLINIVGEKQFATVQNFVGPSLTKKIVHFIDSFSRLNL